MGGPIGGGSKPGRPGGGGGSTKKPPALGYDENIRPPQVAKRPFEAFNPFGGSVGKKNDPRYVRYRQGDELSPLKLGLDFQSITQLQLDLIDAGYLPASGIFAGTWDEKSANGLKNALTDANRNGVDIAEWLNHRKEVAAAGGVIGGGTKGDYELPVFEIENTEDLRDLFAQVSTQTIGHRVSDEEINSMVLAYQQMQIGAQQRDLDRALGVNAAQEAGQMGIGPTQIDESMTSAQDFARRKLTETHPLEAGATKTVETLDQVDAFFRGNR